MFCHKQPGQQIVQTIIMQAFIVYYIAFMWLFLEYFYDGSRQKTDELKYHFGQISPGLS